ncbi:MAG: hypothetical protein QXD05_02655 [Candidatus Pacearchaeota archaeon]
MIKRGFKIDVSKFLKKETPPEEFFIEYVRKLEDCFKNFKTAYEKNDAEQFNMLKKEIINLQRDLLNKNLYGR